ncbi:glycoside hydrolase family 3 N-terminal domain-containing protein [Corynebacterium doosanense]|uniref:beta-N-acetylhexosaminidase n=1 Tax=Corynebacterium doosanense CAU 212 = DSM 45436 TaxID=558173 RepID=A0A097IIL0_9CORY|nr:glycoside hydrolase family 3 N-terminal domain-containing protein [Corynebacterium doosanense]AIT61977.1 beta-N-acetylglucosaminidase [Corynebacterium doosanense CAU 212 = DSM 45436]
MVSRRAVLAAAATSVAAGLAACAREQTPPTPTPNPQPTPTPVPSAAARPPLPPETVAASRVPQDLRGKIASLLHVGVVNFDDALAKLNAGVGGIFITSWADPAILTEPWRNIHDLRAITGRAFGVSIDFEGGRVQRHAQVLGSYPSPREMARTMDPAGVTATALAIGQSLRAHGINVNFAPVLDIDSAGLEVVGDRAFSADPTQAGVYGAAFARGLRDAGVAPVYKHFPGHGQASGDTHLGAAVTPPLDNVITHDLPPFARALAETPAAVMMGHMIVPGLGDGQTPSTLNPAAYDLLRTGSYPGGASLTGLIYTDDLSGMKAITDRISLPGAVAAALSAGADQALWSSGVGLVEAIDAVELAVREGRLPVERLDAAAFNVQLQLVYAGY